MNISLPRDSQNAQQREMLCVALKRVRDFPDLHDLASLPALRAAIETIRIIEGEA